MSNDGMSGGGATLGYATLNSSGAAAVAVADVISIGIPGMKINMLDVTVMSSPSLWKEFVAGLADAGSLDVELMYGAGGAAFSTLLTLFKSKAMYLWDITLPDKVTTLGSVFSCDGVMESLSQAIPHDNKVTQRLSIKLSGVPSFVAAT